MDTAVTIPQRPPTNKGLDYAYLKARGVRLAQRLSSSIWTDYNEHDPGVTTIEQLCYALTELSYRAELPIPDLLAEPLTGRIEAHKHGLFGPRHIFPCNPVSVNDYRKLITDRIPAVANVWLTPLVPPADSPAVNGLYDICVYCPEPERHDSRPRILRQVRRVYSRYRNLCEDVLTVRMLAPHRTVVYADVSIRERTQVDGVMASILFALGNLLAPELRRQPLSDLLKAGKTADEIFNGPLLRRGFISDDQLQPKAAFLPVNDVSRVIVDVPGVIGVQNVAVEAGGQRYGPNESVPVPPGAYLHLSYHAGESGCDFPIRLFRNGSLRSPDPEVVARELAALWASYRRGYPLEVQYEEYFGTPQGQWHDLEYYYSIQNQYPPIYGIGYIGLPVDATEQRRAQARQFKGYLLPFEQLMADYFAQLARVGNLFTIEPDPWATYYWQSLEKSVPDVKPVLRHDYREGLAAIVSAKDDVLERRNRFAGFLLSLYANDLYAERSGGESARQKSQPIDAEQSMQDLLRARLEFLRVLVPSTERRGRGFDYRAEASAHNVAGMEIKCRIEMGLDIRQHRSFHGALVESELRLAPAGPEAPLGGHPGLHRGHIEERFRPLSEFTEPSGVPEVSSSRRHIEVTEGLLVAARELGNWYAGTLPGDDRAFLVCRLAPGEWILVGVYSDFTMAVREAHALHRRFSKLQSARTQLYLVEHILLRFGRRKNQVSDRFPYSFTLTAVVGLPWPERRNLENRRAVEEIIRENTPAHIVDEICFLDAWSLLEFEHLYRSWREALRRRKRVSLRRTSVQLRRFLESHSHPTVEG